MIVWLDTETRSSVDLRKSNVYAYSECPEFAVLMMAYSIDGGPVQLVEGHDAIRELYVPGARYVAHNAGFDRVVLGRLDPRWLDAEQWDDTAARAAEYGLPRSLGDLAPALGCTPKDTAGTRLISLFCKPRKTDGGWNDETTHPLEWRKFVDYCIQDVASMVEIDALLPGWPSAVERRMWVLDQRINDRGLRIDQPLARQAVAASEINSDRDRETFTALTGVENPGSRDQILAWAEQAELPLPNLRAKTVEKTLLRDDLDPLHRQVLELRQELSLASTSKYAAALACVSRDGRVRGNFRFFGAHTGRFSGSGVQAQNLPREKFKTDEEVEAALASLRETGEASPLDLKRLIRPMLLGPFTVVDLAQIEARVLAWLAGEEWALEAFRGGRDLYEETAARMSTPTRTFDRQEGKTAVLALGYGGSVGALRRGDEDTSDDDLKALVDLWRKANPKIVRFWRDLQDSFGEGGRAGRIHVTRAGGRMKFHLPSGRAIHYYGMRFDRYTIPDPDPEAEEGAVIHKQSWRFSAPTGGRTGIYGGSAAENVTQAVARDIMVEGLVRLDQAGYRIVGHVHDEVILEGLHDVDEIARLMCELPGWAEGLPVDAEGFQTYRYKK